MLYFSSISFLKTLDVTSVTLQGGEWISYIISGVGGYAHSPVNKVAFEFKVRQIPFYTFLLNRNQLWLNYNICMFVICKQLL